MSTAEATPSRLQRATPVLRELWFALVAGLIAFVVLAIEWKLWNANLRVPFTGGTSDRAQALTVIQTIQQHGWWFTNDNLGAPFGAQQYDFGAPYGDTFNLLIARFALFFVADAGFAINAVYMAGFVLCAATATLVLRSLRFSVLISIGGGVLFSLLPFHFLREELHIWVSGYWGVPLGAWLTLGLLGHVKLGARVPGKTGWRQWVSWRNALVPLACWIVAGTFAYFAIFYAVLLVAVGAVLIYRKGRWQAAIPAALVVVTILGFFAVTASPSFLYNLEHGKNPVVGQRSAAEAEIYGLKATQMLLPTTEDRIGPLKDIGRDYALTAPLQGEGSSPYLGVLLAFAFLAGVGYVLVGAGRAKEGGRSALLRDSGTVMLVAFLVGTVGGVSSFIAYLFTDQLRGWNRISVPIAFFAVVVLAIGLEKLSSRLTDARPPYPARPPAFAGAIVLVIFAFGAWQQAGVTRAPDHKAVAAQWYALGGLVDQLERDLPENAAVLQLPYTPFPEHGPVGGMGDYTHLAAYVQSEDLRWTAGQLKGRPEDWQALTYKLSPAELIASAAEAGFAAVWLDRRGYDDGGAEVEQALVALGATPSGALADGSITTYRLDEVVSRAQSQPAALRKAAGEHLVRPVEVSYSGFAFPEEAPLGIKRYAAKEATIELDPPGDASRDLVLRGTLIAAADATVRVTLPGGRTVPLGATPEGRDFELRFTVTDEDDTVTLATDAPNVASPNDDRDLRYQLADLTVVDPATIELARRLVDAGSPDKDDE